MTSDLLHDDIERRENFTVRSSGSDGRSIQVMIRDEDHVGDADGRINSIDLRRLLYKRPDIGLILYDCIVEEGIMDPYEFESHSDNEEVDEVVEGLMSPPGGRSRTSSKVAFSEPALGRENDDEEEGEEGAGGKEGENGDAALSGVISALGDVNMSEIDDMVDGLVEESEAGPEDEGNEGDE